MANPQTENGHIDIANEIAEALMRINLSPHESRVLWFIFRKTYGWHKKADWITLSQFSKCIGLDRRLVHRALVRLSAKKIIVISRDDRRRIKYGFQKNYEQWKVSSKKMTVISRDDKVSSVEMTKLSSVEIHTKEKIQKKLLQKKKEGLPAPPDFIPLDVWNDFVEHRKKCKPALTPRAAELIFEKLDRWRSSGQDPGEVLKQSIENGWKGIFELKTARPTGIPAKTIKNAETVRRWQERHERQSNVIDVGRDSGGDS